MPRSWKTGRCRRKSRRSAPRPCAVTTPRRAPSAPVRASRAASPRRSSGTRHPGTAAPKSTSGSAPRPILVGQQSDRQGRGACSPAGWSGETRAGRPAAATPATPKSAGTAASASPSATSAAGPRPDHRAVPPRRGLAGLRQRGAARAWAASRLAFRRRTRISTFGSRTRVSWVPGISWTSMPCSASPVHPSSGPTCANAPAMSTARNRTILPG